jgi:hypothetical protein
MRATFCLSFLAGGGVIKGFLIISSVLFASLRRGLLRAAAQTNVQLNKSMSICSTLKYVSLKTIREESIQGNADRF